MKTANKTVLPGNKGRNCHYDLIRSLPIKSPYIVEGFLGSGMLSHVIQEVHGPKIVTGAEKFKPLRDYYTSDIDLRQVHKDFCATVLVDGILDRSALDEVWRYCKDVISQRRSKKLFPLSEAQALAILLECGYSHSLRFSHKSGHNVAVDPEKALAAAKNGLRSPVVIKLAEVYPEWREALDAGNPANSLFAADPPYFDAAQIYCHDNPTACGLPPIKRAMELGYVEILAFNNFELFFELNIAILAKKWGYSLVTGSTNHRYQIDNKTRKKIDDQLPLFESEDFEFLNNLPSGEWYWFLSK